MEGRLGGTPHTLSYTLNLGNHYLHRNLIIKYLSALTLSPVRVWLLDGLLGLWHSRVDFSLKKQYTVLIWTMICFSKLICFLLNVLQNIPTWGEAELPMDTVAGLPCIQLPSPNLQLPAQFKVLGITGTWLRQTLGFLKQALKLGSFFQRRKVIKSSTMLWLKSTFLRLLLKTKQ